MEHNDSQATVPFKVLRPHKNLLYPQETKLFTLHGNIKYRHILFIKGIAP